MSNEITKDNIKQDYLGFEYILASVKSNLIKGGWKWEHTDGNGEDKVDLSGIVKELLGCRNVCATCKYYYHKEFIQHNNMGICFEDDTSHMFSSQSIFNGNEFGCIRWVSLNGTIDTSPTQQDGLITKVEDLIKSAQPLD